jgi:hypothetical protein
MPSTPHGMEKFHIAFFRQSPLQPRMNLAPQSQHKSIRLRPKTRQVGTVENIAHLAAPLSSLPPHSGPDTSSPRPSLPMMRSQQVGINHILLSAQLRCLAGSIWARPERGPHPHPANPPSRHRLNLSLSCRWLICDEANLAARFSSGSSIPGADITGGVRLPENRAREAGMGRGDASGERER